MKFKSIILGAMMMPVAAFGDSMCIPTITNSTSGAATITPNQLNNRGYWGLGTNCRVSSGTTVADRPVICDNPIIYGESHCSAYGTYPVTDWEKYGGYCWCRMTDLRTSQADANGTYIIAPKVGAWVYYQVRSDDCVHACPGFCQTLAKSKGGRRALMASQGA